MHCRRPKCFPSSHLLLSLVLAVVLICGCRVARAAPAAKYCRLNRSDKYGVAYTITVDNSRRAAANFTTVQRAIDSVPVRNDQWVRIQISRGKFAEKVVIGENKPCIFLHGAGSDLTSIEWDDHDDKPTSPIFAAFANDIVAKGITFKNTYNLPLGNLVWKRATAARIGGDRSAFYECGFVGLQDTFFDDDGRHFYSNCYFEGAIDFIYGAAKSIYKGCRVYMNIGRYQGSAGSITAQKKDFLAQESGFVFEDCEFSGAGKAILGRAWGAYSTVVIYSSTIGNVVFPQGWDAWDFVGHEANLTYVEANNKGPGANTSKRVPWMKNLNPAELRRFMDISFIDQDGWLKNLPRISF